MGQKIRVRAREDLKPGVAVNVGACEFGNYEPREVTVLNDWGHPEAKVGSVVQAWVPCKTHLYAGEEAEGEFLNGTIERIRQAVDNGDLIIVKGAKPTPAPAPADGGK